MVDSNFPWNYQRLDKFLASPQSLVPGTTMPAPPVTEPSVRRTIIAFLKAQSE
jgi:cytochrome c2